jgi:hypothetical protein
MNILREGRETQSRRGSGNKVHETHQRNTALLLVPYSTVATKVVITLDPKTEQA